MINDPTVTAAIIAGLCAVIVAIIAAIPKILELIKGPIDFPHLSIRTPRKPVDFQTHPESLPILETVEHLGVINVFRPTLTPDNISAKVHKQAKLDFDNRIKVAFNELNRLRESQGKRPFYSNPRYRLIKPPHFQSGKKNFVLDLGEADFAYVALLLENDVDVSIKKYVRKKIHMVANQLPKHLQSVDSKINGLNEGQLGVQMVLITADGYTLLRKRGQSVLEFSNAWDISFSGYCGQNALLKTEGKEDELDIGVTVRFELEKEIGLISADPRSIVFTGLHWSNVTGTTGIVGYWQIQASRSELASCLNKKFPGGATVFETTEKANEVYVWDNKNILVEFDGPIIAQALQQAEKSLSNNHPAIVPIARSSLLLALSALGKSTAGLEN
jgi:hypothetical protein